MRSLLIRHLPTRIKRLYRALRGSDSDGAMLDRIELMRSAHHAGHPIVPASPVKKILFNSQFGWPYGIVEYSVAAALRERGHDVVMAACGGLPRYCELMTASQTRPPCDVCHANVARHFDAFDLPHIAVKDYITDRDRAEAEAISLGAKLSELRAIREDGVPVGELGFLNLFQYIKGYPFDLTGDIGTVFRDCVNSAILVTRAAGHVLDDLEPDILCTTNGKFLQWAPFVHQAAKRNIPYVTWEDYQISPSGVTFASNELAHEMRHTALWKSELEKPLTPEEEARVRGHFESWSRGEVTTWAGYSETGSDETQVVRERLNVRAGKPIIAIFPNLSWDSSSVGFDTAFSSMYEWLYAVVDYAGRRQDLEFVVRAHPAEARLPDAYKPPVPVCEAIRLHVGAVPANVRLVEGAEAINSYALAGIADVSMVYTSTLGIELPLRGKRPWVAAGAYYSGKGFTLDIESAEHMCRLLDANEFDNRLTKEQIARAERMAYLIRFRGVFNFPLMPKAGEFSATNWAELGPNGNRVLDALCERLLNHDQFTDLAGAR